MIVTQEIQKEVISAIVNEYNQQSIHNSVSSTKQIARIGIEFIKLFQSENSSISFVILNNKVNICLQSHLTKSKSKITKKRVTKAINIASLGYNDVIQIISFIKQLEDENYLIVTNDFSKAGLPTISTISEVEDNENKAFIVVNDSKLSDLIEKYHYCNLVPTSALIDLFNNDYMTPEEKRFEESQKTSRYSIGVALIIGVLSLLATFATSTCSLNKKDLGNIEGAIHENNLYIKNIDNSLLENNLHINNIEDTLNSIKVNLNNSNSRNKNKHIHNG
jgi:hypothetical protein